MTGSVRDRQGFLKAISLALSLGALAWTFRDVHWERVTALISKLGMPGVLLVLLPQAAGITLDTLAFHAAFSTLGARVRFATLVWVRLSTEAFALAVPGGAVVAEPLKVPLLRRQAQLETSVAIAGVVARKYLVLTAQAGWLALCALLAVFSLAAQPQGSSRLAFHCSFVVAFMSVALAAAALFVRLGLSSGSLATGIKRWLSRIPSPALRQRLSRMEHVFEKTDGTVARLFSGGRAREAGLTLVFACAWATEALETYLILRLLGPNLDFGVVALMEAALTLLRNTTFLIPAGIGVQDLGYALFLRALGVTDANELSAAFTLVKRGKELLLIVLGFSLLGADAASTRKAANANLGEAAA